MRFPKKTESSDELVDELTSMLTQGAERIALVEHQGETENVVTQWPIAHAFATHSIARTIQRLVDQEGPLGRLYMLRAYRGPKEIDRVLVDVQSTRAELVGPAGSAAIEPSGAASAAFTHVMQMNERLMHQLTASSAATVTTYGQIVDVMRVRTKEVEDDNGRLRAELRACRDTDNDRDDRALKRQMGHEKSKMAWSTVNLLAPAVLQHLGTHKGSAPNPILQQQALGQLFESLSPEQTHSLLATLSDEQKVAFMSVYNAYTKLAAAAKAADGTSPAPSTPSAAPAAANATSSTPSASTARLAAFVASLDQESIQEVLTFKQWKTLMEIFESAPQEGGDLMPRFFAWSAMLSDAQRVRLGETFTPEQRAELAALLSPETEETAVSAAPSPSTTNGAAPKNEGP